MDGEGVMFVVGAVGVSQTGGTHGEATGVPGAGYFERVGGEGSEDIGGGVGRDIFLETCGEWFVDNVFDGKWKGGGAGDRVGRGKVVE
jgi:hypothetical protein